MLCENCKKEEVMEGYPWCKKCGIMFRQFGNKNMKDKLYQIEHKEELKAYRRKYYLEHKDMFRNSAKAYRENNKERLKEYRKAYYKKNKERLLANTKKYREENKESLRVYRREYYRNYWRKKKEEMTRQVKELQAEVEKLKAMLQASINL